MEVTWYKPWLKEGYQILDALHTYYSLLFMMDSYHNMLLLIR